MLTLDQIKRKLEDRRIDIVAERTGIHRNTIARIKSGQQANPTYHILQRLSAYLEGTAVE
jgi:transcriptional regulator with XRE-family HTH domain